MRKSFVTSIALLSVAAAQSRLVWAAERPVVDVVLVDFSSSFEALRTKSYAVRVANDVGEHLNNLGENAKVMLGSIGDYTVKNNVLRTIAISTRARPEVVKAGIMREIASLPESVAAHKIVVQNSTNIVGSLMDLARRLRCVETEVHVILVTDGMEASADFGERIPARPERLFAGCESLVMIGVGGSAASPRQAAALIKGWERFGIAAGFKSASALR